MPGMSTPQRVLRLSNQARLGFAALGAAFDVFVLVIAFVCVAKFSGGTLLALLLFLVAVGAAMSWVMWRLVSSRITVTDDVVELRYGFFPTVRVDRSTIVGLETKSMDYTAAGAARVPTPMILTSDGRRVPVLQLGRRGSVAASIQLGQLRQLLGV